jgi:Protein of unknown function (DUF1173)
MGDKRAFGILIAGRMFEAADQTTDNQRYLAALKELHDKHESAVCLCGSARGAVFVRRLMTGALVLARAPNGKDDHVATCRFSEPTPARSVQSDQRYPGVVEDESTIAVRLETSLRAGVKLLASSQSGGKTAGSSLRRERCPLQWLMYLLWQRANLHRWNPGRDGYRPALMGLRLREVAEKVLCNGEPLRPRLWVVGDHDDNAERAMWRVLLSSRDAKRRAICVGPIKGGMLSEDGMFRWMPRAPCMRIKAAKVQEDLAALGRYEEAWAMLLVEHDAGRWQVVHGCGMQTVDAVPVKDAEEAKTVRELIKAGKRFRRPLWLHGDVFGGKIDVEDEAARRSPPLWTGGKDAPGVQA